MTTITEFLIIFSVMYGFLIAADAYLYNKINDGIKGYVDSWKSDFRKLVS